MLLIIMLIKDNIPELKAFIVNIMMITVLDLNLTKAGPLFCIPGENFPS